MKTMKIGIALALIVSLASTVTACLPEASLAVAFDKIQASRAPVSASATPTATPLNTAATLRIEAEPAVKTAGSSSLEYPVQESRSGGEQVLMFSGGDAGSQATLTLPELKGKYQVKIHWLNSSDSPAMEIQLGAVKLNLPDSNTFHSDGQLQTRDLGLQTLSLDAGSSLIMTVKGDVIGKGNAWIAVDYFEFTPVS